MMDYKRIIVDLVLIFLKSADRIVGTEMADRVPKKSAAAYRKIIKNRGRAARQKLECSSLKELVSQQGSRRLDCCLVSGFERCLIKTDCRLGV